MYFINLKGEEHTDAVEMTVEFFKSQPDYDYLLPVIMNAASSDLYNTGNAEVDIRQWSKRHKQEVIYRYNVTSRDIIIVRDNEVEGDDIDVNLQENGKRVTVKGSTVAVVKDEETKKYIEVSLGHDTHYLLYVTISEFDELIMPS